jgi:DNA-binding transcriptional LysR family regulator
MENIVDVAFVSYLPKDKVEALPVAHDELVLIAGPRHRLAKKRQVHIRELGDEPFVAHNVSSPSRDKVVEAFRRFNTTLHISMEIASLETIKKLVARNLGLAFVPLICVREELERGDVIRIPVDGFSHARTVWLLRRRSDAHSQACNEFTRLVASLAKSDIYDKKG